jgi:hypothetical protein
LNNQAHPVTLKNNVAETYFLQVTGAIQMVADTKRRHENAGYLAAGAATSITSSRPSGEFRPTSPRWRK